MDLKTATLTKHTPLTYNIFELAFEAEDSTFKHEAGQFVTVNIPQPEGEPNGPILMRSYSISSQPKPGYFELCVKQIENGHGSAYLNSLKPGEKISFLGPLGHFTFKSGSDSQILLIATGTGIAPIKSIIENQLKHQLQSTNASTAAPQQFQLLFGVRHIKDIFYKDFFDQLAKKYPNFKYTLTLSQPESPDWEASGGKIGRITAHLEKLDFSPNEPFDPKRTNAYVCGLKDMVLQVTEMLQQKGLPKEALYSERFN
ncbi:MAG: FAD-dependent oxidoreductase [Candidatus Gracilibacteria bacterium]